MFGKTFGKRVVEPANPNTPHGFVPAGPDSDGVARHIPSAIWDGPNGAMLRDLGFSPDDSTNLALTPERARVMEDEATQKMDEIIARVEAHVSGLKVGAWAMIPWAVWQGLNAEFLIKAGFFPSSPWNNMLLPMDAMSAEYLDLPQHPRTADPALDENLSRLIDELRVKNNEEHHKTWLELTGGDWSALDRYKEFRDKQFGMLIAMTRYVADMVFGAEACARHDEHFGFGLSEVTDQSQAVPKSA